MSSVSMVEAARQSLGPVGAYVSLPLTGNAPVAAQRDAARRLEAAGYTTAWVNETVGGRDPLIQIALLLGTTERITFGTGIANLWARAPQVAHAASTMLADAYPGRLVLGLGVGYPAQAESVGREFGSPLTTTRDYLERMAAPGMVQPLDAPYPRIVAANGPKMIALACELADGIFPAGQPPEFTARARKTIGPDKLLVVSHAADLDNVDRDTIAAVVRAHQEAGADHVVLMPPIDSSLDLSTALTRLEHLAPAVL